MKFLQKLAAKEKDLYSPNAVTVAFLGDSVTQGCFECYIDEQGRVETVFDTEQSYSAKLRELLQTLYPRAQINIVNSGISGDGTVKGLERLDDAVLRYKPDLTVVSFGLNDSGRGLDGIDGYRARLGEIFSRLTESGSEVIFLAPCVMNSYVSAAITEEKLRKIAENTQHAQNDGVLGRYFEAAHEVANEYGVRFCDCYSKWMRMQKAGVDTTALLANRINHPTRKMHWLLANTLLDTVFED